MKKKIESQEKVRLHRRISQDQRIGLKRSKASSNQPREKMVRKRPHWMKVQNQIQKAEIQMATITKEMIPKAMILEEEEMAQVRTYQLGTPPRSTRCVER